MDTIKQSTELGPTKSSKCPECGNSLQNVRIWRQYDQKRCANCKLIFKPYPCQEELIELIDEIFTNRSVGADSIPIEYFCMITCFAREIEERLKRENIEHINSWITYGEYVVIELDTETGVKKAL
jgi:hypothetical protein